MMSSKIFEGFCLVGYVAAVFFGGLLAARPALLLSLLRNDDAKFAEQMTKQSSRAVGLVLSLAGLILGVQSIAHWKQFN